MPRDVLETDDSAWPIVVHRTVGIPSEAQVDRFIARATEHLGRGEPYVVIFDNAMAGRATSYMRGRATAWLEEHGEALGKRCLGTALVFRNAALRFVMSAVMLVVRHPVPIRVCRSLDEARAWSEEQLAEARRMVV